MYDEQDALGNGVSTGWEGLDAYYRVTDHMHPLHMPPRFAEPNFQHVQTARLAG
jgi:hypothetical protein